MSRDLQPLERGTAVQYDACGGIWLMTLFAKPGKADMLLARPALAEMKRRHPAGFPTLTWVLPEAGYQMDGDARDAAAKVTKEFDVVIRGQATLITASGFQAAAVRAIISGLDLLSRSASEKKVFSDLRLSVAWCLARTPTSNAADLEALARAIGQVRDAVPMMPA